MLWLKTHADEVADCAACHAGVDGAPAGVHSYPPNAWTPVAPGTVVDAIYSKVC